MKGTSTGNDSDSDAESDKPESSLHTIDDLFKKSTKETTLGVLKARFLGNAIKDYQLVKVSDDMNNPSNKPSFSTWTRARSALVQLLNQDDPLASKRFIFIRRRGYS